jgi:hypothetical protein
MVEAIDYEAVLADLEEQRSKLDSAIEAVRGLVAIRGGTSSGSNRVRSPQDIRSDAFFGLGISDAAKKYLGMVRTAQSVSQVWEALKKGGLPETKYNAVYNALSRREKAQGDVVALPDKSWGLAEWYGNSLPVKRPSKPAGLRPQENGAEKKAAEKIVTSALTEAATSSQSRAGMSMLDHCEAFIREAGESLHITILVGKLQYLGITTNPDSLSSNMRKEKKQRFKNLGNNNWTLKELAK